MIIKKADINSIELAVRHISRGEVIAFPTETVYGLAADASNPKAVQKIYDIKNRSSDMPLQLMVHSYELAEKIGVFNERSKKLATALWPGPITIVVKKKIHFGDVETIGIRLPDNKIALEMLRIFGKPIASSSANISTEKNSLTAEDVIRNFNYAIPMILDGGKVRIGLSSTVIDCSDSTGDIKVLREGYITIEEITTTVKK